MNEDLIRKWRGVRYGHNGNGSGHNTSENPFTQPEVSSTSIHPGNNGHEEPIVATNPVDDSLLKTTT